MIRYYSDAEKWHKLERVNHKGGLYFVIFKSDEPRRLSNEDITLLKEELGCDTALRANGMIYFCQQISEAEILEEYKNNEND